MLFDVYNRDTLTHSQVVQQNHDLVGVVLLLVPDWLVHWPKDKPAGFLESMYAVGNTVGSITCPYAFDMQTDSGPHHAFADEHDCPCIESPQKVQGGSY